MYILITGAAGGIARATIDKLKHTHHHIYVAVHTRKQLELVEKRYQEDENITCLHLDITKKEDVKKIEDLPIDVLVSNAAIGYGGSVAEMPIDKIKDNFEVNVFKNLELIQLVLKKMIKRKHGRVVIISSLAGDAPVPFLGSYCASKASLSMIASSLWLEMKLLSSKIDIVTVKPGLYQTGFNQVMTEYKYDQMTIDTYFKKQLEWLKKYETPFFHLLETKNLDQISDKIVTAITTKHPKKVYRSRISQILAVKFYHIFFE